MDGLVILILKLRGTTPLLQHILQMLILLMQNYGAYNHAPSFWHSMKVFSTAPGFEVYGKYALPKLLHPEII